MPLKRKFSPLARSLSTRLLLLTISFVMLAEVLIYLPSMAQYRKTWLEERLVAAQIASLAIEAAPDYMVSEKLTRELLSTAGVEAIIRKRADNKQIVLGQEAPMKLVGRYDLREASALTLMKDALLTMLRHLTMQQHDFSLIEVTGYARSGTQEVVQISLREEPLCHALFLYSRNILLLSIIISLITAGLVFLSLHTLMVHPIRRITESMVRFREAPEDSSNRLPPSSRKDEIGTTMRELVELQDQLRQALNQKTHLAHLGIAVSKINHDLRNILASAQLVSDHLSTLDDPIVQKMAPRLFGAVDRAIALCENTLRYGRAQEHPPVFAPIALKELVNDVTLSLGLDSHNTIKVDNNIADDLVINADTDQLFRIFLNLGRNAQQAMPHGGTLTFHAQQTTTALQIDIMDTGKGIPDKIRPYLFQPFSGSANGGSGLGLSIAKDLIKGHGGELILLHSDQHGSCFRLTFPAHVIMSSAKTKK